MMTPREDDEPVKFQDLASTFRSEFTSSSRWSIRTWLSFLQRGGGIKKRFPYCVDPSSPETLLYFEEIHGRSGGKHNDPTQDNVLLPNDFAEHIYHVGSSHGLHSIMQSGLILGWKNVMKGRHAVFFTAVNAMFVDQHKEVEYDVTKPRIAVYKNNWKLHRNTVYWCNLCRQHICLAPHFLLHSGCTDLFLLAVRVYSHTLTPCSCIAQVTNHIVCISPKNTYASSRNVVHLAELDDTTHGHSFLAFSRISLPAI